LQQGDRGPEVAALQARLTSLGYWLADADGTYGMTTAHAVTAFQKRAGLERDGVAGALTQTALLTAVHPTPQSPAGHHFEVDLASQTMLLVDNGAVEWVFDVSTGAVAGTTPKGEFAVFRQVNGYDHGPLGTLYRPKYFKGGVAIHGLTSVPAYPASHGCVRVVNPAMDFLWESDAVPIGTPVVVY
jgi:peptidoglycan hydrolase-like protein with peptidoglycan-binding domain